MNTKLLKWMLFDGHKKIELMLGSLLMTLAAFWICAYFSNPVMEAFKLFLLMFSVLLMGLILFRTWSGNPRPFNDRDESD
ncbi:hypothetical protein IM774_06865 [Erysipelotrichaceae bacterium RD49]|nr:hypothetical protein [Erysipelotrichaceae bacterium RD49]